MLSMTIGGGGQPLNFEREVGGGGQGAGLCEHALPEWFRARGSGELSPLEGQAGEDAWVLQDRLVAGDFSVPLLESQWTRGGQAGFSLRQDLATQGFLRWAACHVNSQWTSGTRSMGRLGDSSPARSMRNWSGDEARMVSPKGDTCAAAACWSWWSASEGAAARYARRFVMAPWYVPQ